MRRLFLAAAVCAALLLPAAAAAAAPPAHVGDGHHPRGPGGMAAISADDLAGARARFTPLAARLDPGASTINGTVRDSYGASARPAHRRGVVGPGDLRRLVQRRRQTDGFGTYSMTAMPTTNGEVYADYANGSTTLAYQARVVRRRHQDAALLPRPRVPTRPRRTLGRGLRVPRRPHVGHRPLLLRPRSPPTARARHRAPSTSSRARTTGAAPSSSTTRASSSRRPSTSPAARRPAAA